MSDAWIMGFPTRERTPNSGFNSLNTSSYTLTEGQNNTQTITIGDDIIATSVRYHIHVVSENNSFTGSYTITAYKNGVQVGNGYVSAAMATNLLVFPNQSIFELELISSPVEVLRGETFALKLEFANQANSSYVFFNRILIQGQYKTG